MFDGLQPWHIILLAAVFILLFGWKRLPDASRAIGRSLRIFKAEVKGLHDDEAAPAPPPATPIAAPVAAPAVTAPVTTPAEAVVTPVVPSAPAAVPVTPEPIDPA